MDEAAVPTPDIQQPLPPPNTQGDIENELLVQNEQQSIPAHEKWTRTPHPRGRQAKDPNAVVVRYQCASMESMEAQLRDYIANPTAPADHATLEFAFPTSAAFMVSSGEHQGSKDVHKVKPVHYQTLNRTAISVVDALSQLEPKEQLRKQKAIAKAVVDSVQAVDGHRYSFHNNWVSKEDEACRFSYYCNDSTLNKGRAANEGAGMAGKRKVKPVYDCHGLIHIKFSVTKQNLEVHYRHIPLHKTYEERAPPPRKDSRRRKFLELFDPDKLPKPGERKRKSKEPNESKEARPRKKRRASEPLSGTANATPNGDDSLAPLMDFLGSAEKEDDPVADLNGNSRPASTSGLPIYPAEKIEALKKTRVRPKAPRRASSTPKGRARPSNIPGTMAGYLVGNDMEIQWTYEKDKAAQQNPNPTEPLQGIAAAAAAEVVNQPPAEPKTELDLLKQKLIEAEQRIQRLEAEKQRPMGPPGWPPAAPPTAPQGYGYPYAGYGYHQTAPQAGLYPSPSPQPYQYPPPQQHQQNQRSPTGQNVAQNHIDQTHRGNGQGRQNTPAG